MGSIATDNRKTTLFYNSETTLGKQTYPYVYSSDKNIHAIDISKTKVTGTQWITIAKGLETTISSLINTDHPDFTIKYSDKTNLSDTDWVKVLNANPKCLKAPVLIFKNTYHLIDSPSKVETIIKDKAEEFDARSSN